MKYFESIYLGSYAVSMKLYEINDLAETKELDYIHYPVPAIMDIFDSKGLKKNTVDDIVRVLKDMQNQMELYNADYTFAIGNSIHKASNEFYLYDQIKLHTGLMPFGLTNSEQRFFEYEAMTGINNFEDIVDEGSLICDIGGESVQLTLFEKSDIVTTQHLDLGTFDMYMTMQKLKNVHNGEDEMKDVVDKEIDTFLKMYLNGKTTKNLIVMADKNLRTGTLSQNDGIFKRKDFITLLEADWKKLNDDFEVSPVDISLYYLLKELARDVPCDNVIIPSVTIHEGMLIDYLSKSGIKKPDHDFEHDVISAASSIARRYGSYFPHLKVLDKLAVGIFDCGTYHGMGKRERLLLRTAIILHDCGKYISLSDASSNTQRIILSSEILGLTHKERKMVAYICEFNRKNLPDYKDMSGNFTREEYWTIVKLVAILRVANALDRSHKQKLKKADLKIENNVLYITVGADTSIALERGLFTEKADFFERVMGIRPVIREA